ncbi:MAG TPA: hypothetical protein VFI39_05775 [Gemmatimonadales bacterium]|nr:hypothetical protein [Gemmatimonadales bacterium]
MSAAESRLFGRLVEAVQTNNHVSELSDREGLSLQVAWSPAIGIRARARLVRAPGEAEDYAVVYEAQAACPADYPSDLPFVTDQVVIVVLHAGPTKSPAAHWIPSGSIATLGERVLAESRTAGWTLGSTSPTRGGGPGQIQIRELWRGPSRRFLTIVGDDTDGLVGLFDNPVTAAAT